MEVDSWSWEAVDGSVRKRIIQQGIIGERPVDGAVCTVQLRQTNGEECVKKIVIGNYDTKWEKFLERCIRTMNINEESIVDWGSEQCVVTLKVIQQNKQIFELSDDESLKLAIKHKERGKELFNEDRIDDAYSRFQRAIKLLIFIGKEDLNIRPIYNTICNNIALCHLKFERFEDTVTVCNKVLETEPDNIKCLLRRAAAYKNLRDFEKCHGDLIRIISLEPNNLTAKTELLFISKQITEMNNRYNGMVKKMFPFS